MAVLKRKEAVMRSLMQEIGAFGDEVQAVHGKVWLIAKIMPPLLPKLAGNLDSGALFQGSDVVQTVPMAAARG